MTTNKTVQNVLKISTSMFPQNNVFNAIETALPALDLQKVTVSPVKITKKMIILSVIPHKQVKVPQICTKLP